MNTTKKTAGFEGRLLVMLRDAVPETTPAREGERPSRRWMGVRPRPLALVGLSSLLLMGLLLLSSIAIGGRPVVEVDGLRALRHPALVERELQAAGTDAKIVEVPLTPAGKWNGVWWWVTFERPTDLTQEEFDMLRAQVGLLQGSVPGGPTRLLQLPKVDAKVTLFVGRDAQPGEFRVDAFDRINELSPAGAFFCLGADANDPDSLGAAIKALGYDILWQVESNNHGGSVTSPPPDTVATWAWLRGPGLVDIRLAPEGRAAERYQEAEGTYPQGSAVPWTRPCA